MDELRQHRKSLRSSFTKTANSLAEVLAAEQPDVEKIKSLLDQLEDKGKKLIDLDSAILARLQADGCTQEDFDKEFEAADAYNDRFIECRGKARRYLSALEEDNVSISVRGNNPPDRRIRKYRLPEIEFKKFGGDLRDWLGFWGQFQKIDCDNEMALEDKYQYLLQATVAGSRAREIVESFPPSGENYAKAVQHLKSRFGREDVLIEVYVRDLLGLVLRNSSTSKLENYLSKLYDRLETQLRALETLGVTSDKYAAMLFPLVESCLPEEVLRAWERSTSSRSETLGEGTANRLPSLMKFLHGEVVAEERIRLARTGFGKEPESRRNPSKKVLTTEMSCATPSAAGLYSAQSEVPKDRMPVVSSVTCVFCAKNHVSYDCQQAKQMTLQQRRDFLVQNRLCFLCLRRGHIVSSCSKKFRCPVCKKRHCILLCPQVSSPAEGMSRETREQTLITDNALTNQSCSSDVKLQTLKVYVRGSTDRVLIRALIDSGSQRSYISQDLVRKMGFPEIGMEVIAHNLFGGLRSSERTHKRYRIHLSNMKDDYRCNFEVLDQQQICSGIPTIQRGSWTNELQVMGIVLSDLVSLPVGQEEEEIHLLIGADVAGKLLTGRVQNLSCGAVAVETRLGWTLIGKLPQNSTRDEHPLSSVSTVSLLVGEAKIADLWRLESLGIVDPSGEQTVKEMHEATLQHFRENVSRDNTGRYQVALPWIEGHPPLSNSYYLAEKRLKNTVKNLQAKGLLSGYQEVLCDWLHQGIIEELPLDDLSHENGHYLPHRAVVKDSSTTTKIRPVFDASAQTRNGCSLNSCLEKGPNLMERIVAVLMRFRQRKVGVMSDIRQAFLQILVKEEDRDYLRFLWWENGDPERVKVYQHCRVVFGLSCSPFLLGATIEWHLDHASENTTEDIKETVSILKDSFYVDNCVASVSDTSNLNKFISEAKNLMSAAQFDLRDWMSNVPCDGETNAGINYPEFEEPFPFRATSVLGLLWDRQEDTLSCDLKGLCVEDEILTTKRQVLAVTHRIFDPIGFTCPVTLYPKVLLQKCWNLKLNWDQELPKDMSCNFKKWLSQVRKLEEIKIPRWLGVTNWEAENQSLHVFCDASKLAYATCIYVRVEIENKVLCQLVRARSRVAPLKTISIPRLELLACCIGARLAENVKQDMRCDNLCTYYWTDSSTALCWIRKEERWATFVGNRVNEIRTLSDPGSWRHIAGVLNPADLPSRGCTGQRLLDLKWWEGPTWLQLPSDQWPNSEPDPEEDLVNTEKMKTVTTVINQIKQEPGYQDKFSSFLRLVRVTAWIYRFLGNSRTQAIQRVSGELTPLEIEKAEMSLFRNVQHQAFQGESDKSLLALQPFCDQDGILRVKTRVHLRPDSWDFRYPILLPSKHRIVILLIQWRHQELCHAGIQVVLVDLRERFWILRARKSVREVIGHCGRCSRFKTKNVEVLPAPLPVNRVRDAVIFEITGVDMAGPMFLKGGQKTWFVIFTCAVYRAIHLELVRSLSTEAFLMSLRRFIARRGKPSTIYSDNGTNFVGASRILCTIDWSKIQSGTSAQGIAWIFSPPTAAWWGGWWERLIAMVKTLLRRVLGRAALTYEELVTVLCDAERVINSRPLTYISEDPSDLRPLTPSHFLLERGENGVPDLHLRSSKEVNRRYKYRQKLREDIRKRFRSEYLGQLRQTTPPKRISLPVEVGQVVLVGSDATKRLDWPLARIVQVFPGKDGVIRVVRVQTAYGKFLRPVQKLYRLEIEDEEGKPSFLRMKKSESDEVRN